jgi:hypothetical protein
LLTLTAKLRQRVAAKAVELAILTVVQASDVRGSKQEDETVRRCGGAHLK